VNGGELRQTARTILRIREGNVMAVDVVRVQNIPLFAALDDEQRAAAASKLEERTVTEGAHISTEGGSGYFFFLIEAGTARVTRGDELLAELGPGFLR